MHISVSKLSDVESQILSVLRRRRFYTLPHVRAYVPAEKALLKLQEEGFVIELRSKKERYFEATDNLIETCVAKDIKAEQVKVGNVIYKGCNFFEKYSERWYEADRSNVFCFGKVSKIEHKIVSKNIFENLTFKKSLPIIEITFEGKKKKQKFSLDSIFNIIRVEY